MKKISVTIYKRVSNNKENLYANIYGEGKRKQISLHLFLYLTPKTQIEKEHNKHVKILAQKKCNEIESELLNQRFDFQATKNKNISFKDFYFEVANENKAKKTTQLYYTAWENVIKNTAFENFDLIDFNKKNCEQLIKIINEKNISQNTKHQYFNKFRAVLNLAYKRDLIKNYPLASIENKPQKEQNPRIFLSREEVEKLENTKILPLPYTQRAYLDTYENIKKAFLFSCFCGLRYSDLKKITPNNVIKENGLTFLKIDVIKTKQKSLIIPMTAKALKYIDNFAKLPNISAIDKKLKRIAKICNINKNISFHTARHTFASNALINGANIVSIQKVLGHTDLKTTMIYADMTNTAIFKDIENAFNF